MLLCAEDRVESSGSRAARLAQGAGGARSRSESSSFTPCASNDAPTALPLPPKDYINPVSHHIALPHPCLPYFFAFFLLLLLLDDFPPVLPPFFFSPCASPATEPSGALQSGVGSELAPGTNSAAPAAAEAKAPGTKAAPGTNSLPVRIDNQVERQEQVRAP